MHALCSVLSACAPQLAHAQVFNEMNSPFYEENASGAAAKRLANMSEADVAEANMKYSLNGFTYCNIPGLNMTAGERCVAAVACQPGLHTPHSTALQQQQPAEPLLPCCSCCRAPLATPAGHPLPPPPPPPPPPSCSVRWYVTSLGSEDSIHTAHWHGITFNVNGKHMDQVVVQASQMIVADAIVDNPGTWLFHCHLTDHIHGGMMALFHVNGTAAKPALNGKVRQQGAWQRTASVAVARRRLVLHARCARALCTRAVHACCGCCSLSLSLTPLSLARPTHTTAAP